MNRRNKIVYTLALSAFVLKIGMELLYLNGNILWPSIGMMWCITAGINETKRSQNDKRIRMVSSGIYSNGSR